MKITFAPRGILQIDDATIIYRNFSGAASKYNRAGDRNFAVVIENEVDAEQLVEFGWNVKIKPPREEGDAPFMYLPVKVKFNDRGPKVYLQTGNRRNVLDEDAVSCLDDIDILSVDLDIRPYDWTIQEGTPNEKSGRTAYLQSIHVTQRVDRFAERYAEDQF
jgi:hypothetical protein